MELTKRQVKAALGFSTDAELARFFHVLRWAVGQWPEDEPIPEGRQWELRARRPALFTKRRSRKKKGEPGTQEREPEWKLRAPWRA